MELRSHAAVEIRHLLWVCPKSGMGFGYRIQLGCEGDFTMMILPNVKDEDREHSPGITTVGDRSRDPGATGWQSHPWTAMH